MRSLATLAVVPLALLTLSARAPAQAQTLVVALSALPTSLDSADTGDVWSLAVAGNVTETLIRVDGDASGLVPWLATAWRANDDATVWTLELREGVRFHDGTPFDAAAVKFNLDRWNDPDHPYAFRDRGKAYAAWTGAFGAAGGEGGLLREVRVVSDHVVELVLSEPLGLLPSLLASPLAQIDAPAAVRAAGADYGTPAVGSVGTGPFRFARWTEGRQLELRRADGYWGAPAKTDRVVIRGIPDATARLTELLAGAVDVALHLEPDDVPVLRAHDGTRLVAAESELNVGFLAMNQATPPFGDVRVRRAVAHAIDRAALVEAFFGPFATVARDHLPPSVWGHADAPPYRYDPERARELLVEAGLPDGFTTELWYPPLSSPLEPAPRAMAEAIASYLADVGIDARPRSQDWTAYLADANDGRLPLYLLGWGMDAADPDDVLRPFFGERRYAAPGWDDRDVVAWLEAARRSADPEVRAELYARVLTRVRAQVPSLPTVHARSVHGVRANVRGFEASPIPSVLRLDRVWTTP